MAVTDYKVWLLAGIVITKTSAAAVTSFIPTLVKTFGYNKINTLLLVAPPYVFAAICAMCISISSDRRQERYCHLVIPLSFGMVGYIIAAATTTLAPRYVSLFLMLGGVYGGFNVAIAWISATLPHPMEKRAAALALTNVSLVIFCPIRAFTNLLNRWSETLLKSTRLTCTRRRVVQDIFPL
jgi:MFS family permease